MKNKTILITLLAALILLIGVSAVLYNSFKNFEDTDRFVPIENYDTKTETTKKNAPDFTLYDKNGSKVSLSQFKGTPTVVNFWASWCSPCKSEMPTFEKIYNQYKDRVNFLIVNMTDGDRETKEKAISLINEEGYTFPILFDTDFSAAFAYNVTSIPSTYFIDKNGILITGVNGAIDETTLKKGIEMILE